MDDRKYQVYRIDDTKTGHYYIGIHCGNIFEDNYWGSGRGIEEHIQNHGKGGLKRSVLHDFWNEDECIAKEAELVTWDVVNNPMCLNRRPGGWYCGKPSYETRSRMSKSHSGEKNSMFGLIGENNPNYGKTHTKESKERMSKVQSGERNPMYGNFHSEETRKKMSESKIGKKNPFYGKTHSEEVRRKLSIINSGKNHPMYGKRHSEETKRKISESRLKRGCN